MPDEKEEKGIEKLSDIAKIVGKINPSYYDFYNDKPAPVFQTRLVYDSTSETLEPLYFWILDFAEGLGLKTEKLIDNFIASPGSGYFAELGARATRMQEEGMKLLGSVNTVIKSIINIIYDLKEFEIRLKHYDAAKSRNKEEAEAGMLALKQIWMDNVDIKRGRGSINLLTAEFGFTTLRDAFMVAKSVADVDKMDLNERVKRILKPRVAEFLEWWKRSEMELRKRYEIERSYLKSQVGALKLYTRWAKPYLKAAEQLMMRAPETAHLVNVFNTIILELALLCKKKIDTKAVRDAAYNKILPYRFVRANLKRNYYPCIFIDFSFRGIPRRIPEAHFVFGGRVEVEFFAVALNDDELLAFQNELDKADINDAIKLVEATTTESLAQLQQDIDYFLKEEKKEEKPQSVNPFAALFGVGRKPAKKEAEGTEEKIKRIEKYGIKKDSYVESVIRRWAEQQAAELCFKIFDVYKKSHDMASVPGGIDFTEYFMFKERGSKVKG